MRNDAGGAFKHSKVETFREPSSGLGTPLLTHLRGSREEGFQRAPTLNPRIQPQHCAVCPTFQSRIHAAFYASEHRCGR